MKRLFFVFAFLIPLIIHAQTIKTDVLVIGSGDAAYAAGLQSSKSGVKTVILTQKPAFNLKDITSRSKEIQDLYAGVEILKNEVLKGNGKEDTTKKFRTIDKPRETFVGIQDNLPTLSSKRTKTIVRNEKKKLEVPKFEIIENLPYAEIKRSGSGWEAKLTKDKSIKAKVLIVTDNPEKIIAVLKTESLKPAEASSLNYADNAYRTTIAGINGTTNFLSLYNLLIPDQENLLYLRPDNLEIGQAAGATAAYAAFFQTKTSLSNLKRIQGELLSYKLALMPFEDVKIADSNWLAMQKVGITGILKAEINNGKLFFNPDKAVSYDEIKQPIKDYYFKSQIWFDDHQNVPINLENTIAMVCYVGNKSVDATKTELQKKWNKNYKFSSKYDLKMVLSRREFSVIINEYLKPFDQVNVDKTGRVIR